MKHVKYLIIGLIAFGCMQSEAPKSNKENIAFEWIEFEWHQDSLGGKYYEKLGINIPITINDTGFFFAQFDLGANTNMLYESTLKSNFNIEQNFNVDTISAGSYYYWLQSPNIRIGNQKSSLQKWIVRDDYDAEGVIGTIGAEELRDKCLLIDYPNDRLAILDSVPPKFLKTQEFFDFEMQNRKVILTATINGLDYKVNFDTGSSITPLLVCDHELYTHLTDSKIAADTLFGFYSWGEYFEYLPGAAIKESFLIGNHNLGNQIVYYMDSDYHRKLYKQDAIIALAGSILFYDNEICIDFKNQRMAIIH